MSGKLIRKMDKEKLIKNELIFFLNNLIDRLITLNS